MLRWVAPPSPLSRFSSPSHLGERDGKITLHTALWSASVFTLRISTSCLSRGLRPKNISAICAPSALRHFCHQEGSRTATHPVRVQANFWDRTDGPRTTAHARGECWDSASQVGGTAHVSSLSVVVASAFSMKNHSWSLEVLMPEERLYFH